MDKVKSFEFVLLISLTLTLALAWSPVAWGDAKDTSIMLDSSTVKSGSDLKVMVHGLVGTKTANFRLTGMTGIYELGEFEVSSADFTQVVKIPADVPPGKYRLNVKGAKQSAKIAITIE
jgi:hypothetical protein